MNEINITKEQFDNFIKVVEGVMHDVIVKDTFEFTAMMNGFTGFAPRQNMAIQDCIKNEIIKLVDDNNKEKATELAYNMSMALESAVAGLGTLYNTNDFTAHEVYKFCKGTFHWLLSIDHYPSMFDNLFNVVYSEHSD